MFCSTLLYIRVFFVFLYVSISYTYFCPFPLRTPYNIVLKYAIYFQLKFVSTFCGCVAFFACSLVRFFHVYCTIVLNVTLVCFGFITFSLHFISIPFHIHNTNTDDDCSNNRDKKKTTRQLRKIAIPITKIDDG